jgi:ABC-type glucose/galactose transport system permease subunit
MTTMIIMYSLRFLCFISESPVCPIAISDLIATMYYMHAQIQVGIFKLSNESLYSHSSIQIIFELPWNSKL